MYEHLRYLVDIAFVVALTFAVYKICLLYTSPSPRDA